MTQSEIAYRRRQVLDWLDGPAERAPREQWDDLIEILLRWRPVAGNNLHGYLHGSRVLNEVLE